MKGEYKMFLLIIWIICISIIFAAVVHRVMENEHKLRGKIVAKRLIQLNNRD